MLRLGVVQLRVWDFGGGVNTIPEKAPVVVQGNNT